MIIIVTYKQTFLTVRMISTSRVDFLKDNAKKLDLKSFTHTDRHIDGGGVVRSHSLKQNPVFHWPVVSS